MTYLMKWRLALSFIHAFCGTWSALNGSWIWLTINIIGIVLLVRGQIMDEGRL